MPRRILVAPILLVSAIGWAAPARAIDRASLYETQLLSRAADGGFPNGPSRNGVISQDSRIARSVAFESDASNIVAGDRNGRTDVFVVDRAPGYSSTGSPWRNGRTRLASRGLNGPANGRSYGPSISGDSSSDRGRGETAPRCVAFVSQASNLVPGDTNGRADAFLYWMGSGIVQRVSVASDGSQSNGSTYDVAVDGACTRVAFTSTASNLAQTSKGGTAHPNYKAAKTRASRGGVKQVYVRVIGAEKSSARSLIGLTYLASASDSGVPGNRDSYGPSWSLRTAQVVAFNSRAGNLDGRDGNGGWDVYVSAATPQKVRFTTKAKKGKKGKSRSLAVLDPRVRVVSVNPRTQRAGNGPSLQASASDQGCFVIFTTAATDVVGGDTSRTTDIARADIRGFLRSRGVLRLDPPGCRKVGDGAAPSGDRIRVTKVARGNGPSIQPRSAGGGDYVVFASAASNFAGVTSSLRDANKVMDSFLWSGTRDVVRLQSAISSRYGVGGQLTLPSYNPYPSSVINYILFETSTPFADLALVQKRKPQWLKNVSGTIARARREPVFHQVYLRYLGAKS